MAADKKRAQGKDSESEEEIKIQAEVTIMPTGPAAAPLSKNAKKKANALAAEKAKAAAKEAEMLANFNKLEESKSTPEPEVE